jgi:hypothetical protein
MLHFCIYSFVVIFSGQIILFKNSWLQGRPSSSPMQSIVMWVYRGQLKTSHTNIGHSDLLFLPEWLRNFCINVCTWVQCRQTTWSRLMKLHMLVCLNDFDIYSFCRFPLFCWLIVRFFVNKRFCFCAKM